MPVSPTTKWRVPFLQGTHGPCARPSTRLALCHVCVRLCRVTPDRATTEKYVRLAEQPISPSDQHQPKQQNCQGAFILSNRHLSLRWVGLVGWIISTSQRGVTCYSTLWYMSRTKAHHDNVPVQPNQTNATTRMRRSTPIPATR